MKFRWIVLIIYMAFLLVACTGSPEEATEELLGEAQPAATIAVAAQPTVSTPSVVSTASVVPTAVPSSTTSVPSTEPSVASTTEADTAVAEPPTLTPPPLPTNPPDTQQVISGQTEDGAFFFGAPDAPVTVIDYSDFM